MAVTGNAWRHVAHAQLRAYQRYGTLLSKPDLLALGRVIEAGGDDVRFIQRERGRRARYQVSYRGVVYYAVYSLSEHVVVTLLPPPGSVKRPYKAQLR
jgi:hypothetical protein